jgi:hypothetical protein
MQGEMHNRWDMTPLSSAPANLAHYSSVMDKLNVTEVSDASARTRSALAAMISNAISRHDCFIGRELRLGVVWLDGIKATCIGARRSDLPRG